MSLGKPVTECELKIQLDDLKANSERFRSLDSSFFPIVLEHRKNSYLYILEMFTRKCEDAVKYHHLSSKDSDQINREMTEISQISKEIEEFDKEADNAKANAFKAAKEISHYNQSIIDDIRGQFKPPQDLELAFKAFLMLKPEGIFGDEDERWNPTRELLKDKDKLAQIMEGLFEIRIKNISSYEIEKAEEYLQQLEGTQSLTPLSKIISTFVKAGLVYWNKEKEKQARREIIIFKKKRIDSIKTELATYKEFVNLSENEIDEIFEKYLKGKQEYEKVKKESLKAHEILQNFEKHYSELEKERARNHRDPNRINHLMADLREDCGQFGHMRGQLIHKLPADTLIG